MAIGNPSFDAFKLPDVHQELRSVLRDLCEKEIAPHAADVDEKARYTDEALAALTSSGFAAIHIPEAYGGGGGGWGGGGAVVRVVVADPDLQQVGHHGPADAWQRGAQEAGAAHHRRRRGRRVVRAVRAGGRQRCRLDADPRAP